MWATVAFSLLVILVLGVFIAFGDPSCAVQVRVESFQAAVIESVVQESIGTLTSCIGSSLSLSTASAMTLVRTMICCGKVPKRITDENTRSQIFKGHVDFDRHP